MNLIVFAGPTIALDRARTVLQADYRPPAQQGDVYLASLDRPNAIGIIDGYFHCVPSVWHKEILAAMSDGIHVFGSASIGALRAAELERFGMEGVGKVFEAFRSGTLEDDDEVAVLHAPAEEGYRPLSEAMVNVRATLLAAEVSDILSSADRAQLEAIAKRLHYSQRCYPILLGQADREGLDTRVLDRFRRWLPSHRVDQKQDDALLMLEQMRDRLTAAPPPKQVSYTLSYTDGWDEAKRRVRERVHNGVQGTGGEGSSGHSSSALSNSDTRRIADELIVHELVLDGTLRSARTGAMARALAIALAGESPSALAPEVVREASVRFRREHGLLTPEQFERWLAGQQLEDESEMARFFRDEALARRMESLFEADANRYLADHLRATDRYEAVSGRARAKQETLDRAGVSDPTLEDLGLTEAEAWTASAVQTPHANPTWRGIPIKTARRAVLRELYYRRLREKADEAAGCPTDAAPTAASRAPRQVDDPDPLPLPSTGFRGRGIP